MSGPVDVSVGACHTTLHNVSSDGTVSLTVDDVPVLAATVPLSTGPVRNLSIRYRVIGSK